MKHEHQKIGRVTANLYKVGIGLIFIICGILVFRLWWITLALEIAEYPGKITLLSIRCQAKTFGAIQPAQPYYQGGKLVCGEGMKEL